MKRKREWEHMFTVRLFGPGRIADRSTLRGMERQDWEWVF